MRISRWAGVVCALVLATGAGPAAQQEDPALEALLTRATWYALDFVDKLSSVVAEERYVQDSSVALPTVPIPGLGGRGGGFSSTPRGSAKHRELKSDFLIVKSAGELWEPFRDVYEVDHIPVRDREERVTKLFLHPTGDTQARAKAIADESGRGLRPREACRLSMVYPEPPHSLFGPRSLLIGRPGARRQAGSSAPRPPLTEPQDSRCGLL